MNLTVLMPMGGLGKRFSDAGYLTPKPLIDIEGAPMFVRALESFPSSWEISHVFVIRADQDERYKLGQMIEAECPNAGKAIIGHNTRGAVETCLEAKHLVNPELPLIVADCDIRFRSSEYEEMVESNCFDGLLLSFCSSDPRYSYAVLGSDGLVVQTAEKNPISDHALLGGYYFESARLFFDLAERFVSSPLPANLNEYYLSHLYNMLIDEGGKVGVAKTESFDIWGTPEELQAYLQGKRT